jgi:hypothetical protein
MAALKPIRFDTTLERFDSNLWHFHIVVPEAVAEKFLKQQVSRVVCSLNGSPGFQCAILSAGKGTHFINVNKKLRDTLKLKEGCKVSACITEDTSEYGLPMPEELEAALAQDDDGNNLFHALTPGKQRTLLYIVSVPKNVDLRIKRALVILEHVKQTNGKIDYKELNRMLKEK